MHPAKAQRLLCVLLAAAAGCARPTELTVEQPQLVTTERRLELTTEAAWFGSDGQVAALLMELPLPGARVDKSYCLYLRLADCDGPQTIGSPLAGGGFVGGYFVQLRGRRRGLTEFTSGRVEIATKSGGIRSGTMSLTCSDGTAIRGEFTARRDERKLRAYERESADARNLLREFAPSTPQSAPAMTQNQ